MGEEAALHVEGSDDKWVVINLLWKHGIHASESWIRAGGRKIKVIDRTPRASRIDVSGIDALCARIAPAIKLANDKPVGFVVDADDDPTARWRMLAGLLARYGLALDEAAPQSGYIGRSTMYGARVGLWIMPDNVSPGALDDVLRLLVPPADALYVAAEEATAAAMRIERRFAERHTLKACLRAWLAWQEQPGCPPGEAIRRGYLGGDAPCVGRFVEWFRRLYEVP